jgi:hypothetical protein
MIIYAVATQLCGEPTTYTYGKSRKAMTTMYEELEYAGLDSVWLERLEILRPSADTLLRVLNEKPYIRFRTELKRANRGNKNALDNKIKRIVEEKFDDDF